MSESRASSILKTAAAGGAAGLLGTGWLMLEADLYGVVSNRNIKRTVISATIAGAVFGAFLGAMRPLHEEKKWSEREQERITTAQPQR
jgi:hypothetical protein